MDNSFIALGLMSGTSLDGIDASIIKSDGENNLDIIDNRYLNYPEEFRKKLSTFILNINNREDIDETSKISPITDLGKLKYAQSLILFEIAKSLNLKVCHLRLAEVYSIDKPERFIYNLHTLNQVMSMSRDELYNKINDNKDTLVHNRNLLLECRSLERILTQIYEMIYETEI